MGEDTVVSLPRPGGVVEDDPLLCLLREGARRMLMQAIQAEVDVFVEGHADLVDDHGRKRIVRNGHAPERRIQTGIGPIEVQRPRVRDRGAGDAPPIRFTSAVLPAYLRRTKNVEELLPWLYLKGVSTGQFEEALTVLLGPKAGGLSPTTIRRLVEVWQDEHKRWQGRDLSLKRYVYVWADGVDFSPRLEHDRQCILVLMGADESGKKELLAIDDGFRESEQSWHELLVRLRDENGLSIEPELATGDGALGFWAAIRKIWPTLWRYIEQHKRRAAKRERLQIMAREWRSRSGLGRLAGLAGWSALFGGRHLASPGTVEHRYFTWSRWVASAQIVIVAALLGVVGESLWWKSRYELFHLEQVGRFGPDCHCRRPARGGRRITLVEVTL